METFASQLKVILLFQLPGIELSVTGRLDISESLPFPNQIQQKKIKLGRGAISEVLCFSEILLM